MAEMKSTLDKNNDTLDNEEEKISKLAEVAIEAIKNYHKKKNNLQKLTEHQCAVGQLQVA